MLFQKQHLEKKGSKFLFLTVLLKIKIVTFHATHNKRFTAKRKSSKHNPNSVKRKMIHSNGIVINQLTKQVISSTLVA